MNPVIKSTLSTLFVALCGGGLAAVGITSATDQATVANAVVGAVLLGVGAVTTWYKAQQHTLSAQVSAINDPPNGLKVVSDLSPSPTVTAASVAK